MSEKKFQVGQTVKRKGGGYPVQEVLDATVTKVGRTLVYVGEGWRQAAFYIADGTERRGPNAGGIGDHIWTLEEWADRERRDEVISRLKAHGIGATGYGRLNQPTKVLEAILAILDAAEEAPNE